MTQRWLAVVLPHSEKGFRKVKGSADFAAGVAAIDTEQKDDRLFLAAR